MKPGPIPSLDLVRLAEKWVIEDLEIWLGEGEKKHQIDFGPHHLYWDGQRRDYPFSRINDLYTMTSHRRIPNLHWVTLAHLEEGDVSIELKHESVSECTSSCNRSSIQLPGGGGGTGRSFGMGGGAAGRDIGGKGGTGRSKFVVSLRHCKEGMPLIKCYLEA